MACFAIAWDVEVKDFRSLRGKIIQIHASLKPHKSLVLMLGLNFSQVHFMC